jgi:hypothetical protein
MLARKTTFQSRKESLSERGINSWFISEHEEEGRGFSGAMGNRIVQILSGGKIFRPFVRIVGTEDPKIGFNFLIGLFGLSICLWMIGHGK